MWDGPELRSRFFVAAGVVTAWVAFAQGTVAVVTGGADPSGGRGLGAVSYSTVALAVAVAGTWFVRAYLRRPVIPAAPPPPPDGDPRVPEGVETREDAAHRLRWAPRL